MCVDNFIENMPMLVLSTIHCGLWISTYILEYPHIELQLTISLSAKLKGGRRIPQLILNIHKFALHIHIVKINCHLGVT